VDYAVTLINNEINNNSGNSQFIINNSNNREDSGSKRRFEETHLARSVVKIVKAGPASENHRQCVITHGKK
jgi:hypothetical protein